MAAMLKVLEKTDEATVNYIQIRTAFVLNEENADNYAGLFSFLKPTIRAVRKAFVNYDDAYKWLIEEKEKTMFDEFDES